MFMLFLARMFRIFSDSLRHSFAVVGNGFLKPYGNYRRLLKAKFKLHIALIKLHMECTQIFRRLYKVVRCPHADSSTLPAPARRGRV
jgi:hypothetical protein